jgi:hypothetical protein
MVGGLVARVTFFWAYGEGEAYYRKVNKPEG